MTGISDLKYKIGQMLVMGFDGKHLKQDDAIVQSILNQTIGGVILFDYNFQTKTYQRNIESPSQLKALTTQLQQAAHEAAQRHHRPSFPLIISVDYEGGKVNRLKEAYGFPPTLTAEAIGKGTLQQAQQQAANMAATLAEAGINLNYAPVLDINVNPDNPIIGKLERSFSADAQTVCDMAACFVKANHDQGVISVFKHFPGHGSSTRDTHAGFVDITNTWQSTELAPYKKLLGDPSLASVLVMISHVVHRGLDPQGYPASLSSAIITSLLREQLGYRGIVVSDDLQMKAITDQFGLSEAVILAVNAGVDLLVFGNQLVPTPQSPEVIIDIIYQAILTGTLPEQRIHDAYDRIVAVRTSFQQAACTAI